MHLKLWQKTADTSGDLIGNKITDIITRASKIWLKNNLETNEEEEILRQINISRTKTEYYWWSKIILI